MAVELFSTSILSNHKIRNRHERYISILQVKKIPFVYHDLASDDDAKSRWRRKALDPQIPGLLVHNEWRGTFEEFEESVELGELDLFLRIDQERAKREAEEGLAPQLPIASSSQTSDLVSASSPQSLKPSTTTPRKPSKHVVAEVPRLAQPRAPSQNALAPALPTAKAGYDRVGKSDTDGFLRSLGISDLSLTEDELNEVLEAGRETAEKRKGRTSTGSEGGETSTNGENADRGEGKYPVSLGLGVSSKQTAVPRTYIPSADAGVKPLRLAKMGNGDSSRSSSAASAHARYNASQSSSRALAAEAQASTSSRSFSTNKLREAVSQGDDLKSAMSQTRLASGTDTAEQVVGREDIDDLLSSLGLDDVKMTDEEAEAFLFDGSIPEGMGASGSRLGRSTSLADRARFETAAHDVAQRARGRGYGSPKTPQMENEEGVSLEDKAERPISIEKAIEATAATAAAESELDVKPVEVEDVKEQIEEEVKKEITDDEFSTPKVATEGFQGTPVETDNEAKGDKDEEKAKVTEEEGKGSYDEKQEGIRTGDSTPRQKTVDLFPAPPPLPDSSIIEKTESDTSRNAEQEENGDKTPPASPPVSPRKSSVQMSPTSSSLGRNSSITNRSPKPEPLELEQSFSAIASQIHDDNRTPLTPSQSGNLDNVTGSPPLRKLSIGSPAQSAQRPSPRDHSLSPPASAPASSRTYNRRKGIDVPRRSVGASPSFDPMQSPSLSANGSSMIQRGVIGQTHTGASVGSLGSSLSATSIGRKASSTSFDLAGSPTQQAIHN